MTKPTWRTWFRVRNENRYQRVLFVCVTCNEAFITADPRRKSCSPACIKALALRASARYQRTDKAKVVGKRYRLSENGAAKRAQYARKTLRQRKKSWKKANRKRRKGPEKRVCATLRCGKVFTVVAQAKARRKFCNACRKANTSYQRAQRYWRNKQRKPLIAAA